MKYDIAHTERRPEARTCISTKGEENVSANKACTEKIKYITVYNQDRILYDGKWEELPFDEKIILEYSVRFFDYPSPCYIHRGAVRIRLLVELEECYKASENEADNSHWRDTLARYMGTAAVTAVEFS